MQKTGNLQDVSLYIHVPFCSRKCPYCHFFVLPDQERFKEPYLNALYREWQLRKPQLAGRRIVSIYFGGGTPTKLPPSIIQDLIETIKRDVPVDTECEITLEANPEDVLLEKMQAYRKAGINRLSIGVQSLNDDELKVLNRVHSAQGAVNAIHASKNAGIDNISIDLMFELPFQTLASWKKTLTAVDSLPISHLSLYNLTFEPHTIFFKKRAQLQPNLPPEEERLAMLQAAVAHLENIGLKRYEISAFAHPDRVSRHNTGYWKARPFLGLGPSAFSYWDKKRFSNHAHLNRYVEVLEKRQFPIGFEEELLYPKNVTELLAVQLRLLEGVNIDHFEIPQETHQVLNTLQKNGWLEEYLPRHWRLTETGMLFYDSVATEIIL